MKTLYIVRHGKAQPRAEGIKDLDRALIPTGIERTRKTALWLKKIGIKPNMVLCSDALRCRETATILMANLLLPKSVQKISSELYLAEQKSLLAIVQKQDDGLNSIMLVAHDPGLCDLFNEASAMSLDKLPTSSVAGIVFQVDSWKEIDSKASEVVFLYSDKH